MRNISFDSPYWFFVLIPLLAGVLVPFFIAIRKDNKSKSVIASLIIHLTIAVIVGFAAVGTVFTSVITKTEIIVVADVSYSSRDNKAEIDRYISEIEKSLPKNTKLGVVLFGKDQKLHTPLGEALTPVTDDGIDTSATDIASALDFASGLFSDGVLKRVVLLTDGAETVSENVSGMIASVEKLNSKNIAIDAIYLDSNIKENVKEVQISGVDYTPSTYLGHKTTADILIQSNTEEPAIISVYKNGEKYADIAEMLSQGYNVINLPLDTAADGAFEYEVRADIKGDSSPYNNSYSFTQNVSADVKVLFVTSNPDDIGAAALMFGDEAKIDVFYVQTDIYQNHNKVISRYEDFENINIFPKNANIPASVEALSAYDEFVLADVDPRDIPNVSAFAEGLETVVSRHGKSLSTFGDIKIQNKSDDTLSALEDMLPVKFGNSAQDPRLFAIVLDVSRSMFDQSQLEMAKTAAIHLLNLLSNDDQVIVVTFAGDIKVVQPTTKAEKRDEIAKIITDLKPEQGTSIGGGLAKAVSMMIDYDNDLKEVMLISDGMNYSAEIVKIEDQEMNAVQIAQYMAAHDIKVSCMNAQHKPGEIMLKNIANAGSGNYYYIDGLKALENLVFSDVADDLTESVITKDSVVNVELSKDAVLEGVGYLPAVGGFVQSKAKISSKTVLTVDYTKASGVTVKVPLYSYWTYGNGKVSTFTSTLTGDWSTNWQGTAGQSFFKNTAKENIPEEKNDTPYFISTKYDGVYSNIEITPVKLNPYAKMVVTVTYPNGDTLTEQLSFDSSRYFYRFPTSENGKYGIAVEYITENGEYSSESVFHISYSPEFDAFVGFDPSPLHAAIRHRGTVREEGIPALTSDEDTISTYRLSIAPGLMAAAVALFVVDIIIRKIKLADIKSLFKKKSSEK